MTTIEIQNMTISERVVLMEEIWDTICHDDEDIHSPSWHNDILKERKKQIDSGKTEFISIEDLKQR